IALIPAAPPAAKKGIAWIVNMQVHTDRRVLKQECCRLDQHGLTLCKMAHEDVARTVQQQQTRRLRRLKAVHEHAKRVMRFLVIARACSVPDTGVEPIVRYLAGSEHEDMLSHVNPLSGVQ